MFLIPALSNISTLYLDVIKTTTVKPLKINEIKALNDENKPIVQYTPSLATFVNGTSRPTNPTSYLIDGNLNTSWLSASGNNAGSINNPIIYRLNFTFSPPAPNLNYIQLYNGLWKAGISQVTGIAVYTNSNKTSMLYSNIYDKEPKEILDDDQTKIEELESMQYAINTSFYKKGASAANQGSVRKRTKKVQYEN
jgi:hypothetical protein